jgi:hypothetical protein
VRGCKQASASRSSSHEGHNLGCNGQSEYGDLGGWIGKLEKQSRESVH